MAASPLHVSYVNIITGFKADCEKLISRFRGTISEEFRDFVPLWKSLKFNLVYEKYEHDSLNVDFKEDSLQIAKTIMLNDHFLGGMFLLYGLYYIQDDPKSCIRIEYYEFQMLLEHIKKDRATLMTTCQPGFMFAKLMKANAFTFVRFAREYSIESQTRARLIFGNSYEEGVDRNTNPRKWLERFVDKVDFIDDLEEVQNNYFQHKLKLKTEHKELNLGLNMVNDDIIGDLQNAVMEESEVKPAICSAIGLRRHRLKNRKLKIKRRYSKKTELDEDVIEPLPPQPITMKRRGHRKGRMKLYLQGLMNNAESVLGSGSDSDPDNPTLLLPDI